MPPLSSIHSTNSGLGATAAPVVLGSTLPRRFTPPLVVGPPGGCPCGCALTPDTSYGFDVIDFARDVVGLPLDPWEELAAIHIGELLPDGRPRMRTALVLVARQNGKTTLAKVWVLFMLFVERAGSVLGTSTDRSYAKKTWTQICDMAQSNPLLARKLGPHPVRLTISEECLTTLDGCEYVFAANNRRAGRSMTVARWLCDELREHDSFDCWDAATHAMNAVIDGQVLAITNQGGDSAVVLDSLHKSALSFLETGEGDPRLGLLEWSAPKDADPEDVDALAQANPNLGRRLDLDSLLGAARRAKAAGGEELTGFLTEAMCVRVRKLNPAVDPGAWARCLDVGDLAAPVLRVAACLDIAPGSAHATLTAAAVLPDGRVRVEPVAAWTDTAKMRRELPALVGRMRPAVFGWLPMGPAAAFAADLKDRGRRGWPPRGVRVEEIRAELTAVCMGFAEQVQTEQLAHSGDPLLNAHVAAAEKLRRGDAWVFSRNGGEGHVDAAYAAAGAVHLARTLPEPVGKPRLIVV